MLEEYKELLTHQFDAAFCTLDNCIDRCADTAWNAPVVNLAFCALFSIAYPETAPDVTDRTGQTGATIMRQPISRRSFNRAGATAVLGLAASTRTAASADRVSGANDRVRLGVIGVANRGGQLIDAFMTHKDMEIVALCDVDKQALAKAREKCVAPRIPVAIFES